MHCHLVEQEESRARGKPGENRGNQLLPLLCLLLTLLTHLTLQRDAHRENMVCCPQAACKEMDTLMDQK